MVVCPPVDGQTELKGKGEESKRRKLNANLKDVNEVEISDNFVASRRRVRRRGRRRRRRCAEKVLTKRFPPFSFSFSSRLTFPFSFIAVSTLSVLFS